MEMSQLQELLVGTVIPLSVLVIMYAMGLGLRVADFQRVLSEPLSLLIAMIGQYLLIPLFAIGMIALLKVPAEIAVGAMIVAAIPGGIVSNAFVYAGRGNSALSVSLTGVSQIIGMVSIPLWISWALSTYYADVADVEFPVIRSLVTLFVLNILPMGLGMLTLRYASRFAGTVEPTLRRVSLFLLFVVIALAIWPNWSVATRQLSDALPLALLICGGGFLFGHLATRAFGMTWRDAFTNGVEIGMQNLTTAVLIAVTILGRTELATYTAVYSIVSPGIALLAVVIYNYYLRPRD